MSGEGANHKKKLLWIVPEQSGGIRTYSDSLWPAVRTAAEAEGWEALEPLIGFPSALEIARQRPDLVHIQHEYGLFGTKIPGLYTFPVWMDSLREALPLARFVATAHTVLTSDFSYPWKGRGWQAPIRWLANRLFVPAMRQAWGEETWSKLDAVIVHSAIQEGAILRAGAPQVRVIPHFVPSGNFSGQVTSDALSALVFGYFSPEKGQDVVIQAWARLKAKGHGAKLVLAGGVRRPADRAYHRDCLRQIGTLGLEGQIEVTGFLPAEEIDARFGKSALVIAPFRETSGSGSLVQALGRKAAVLASDLPLNREIAEREPGSLAFFRSEDPDDLAKAVIQLLGDSTARKALSEAAGRYAARYSPEKVAAQHFELYRSCQVEAKK